MKLFVAFISIFFSVAAFAQGHWQICLNNKSVLKASVESEEKNVVIIKGVDLKKNKNLTVDYKEGEVKNNWERTIMLYDENDHELNQQKGTKFTLSNAALKDFFQQSKTLKIYTLALPSDPKLKAAIRVRRVHLCTLILH